MNPARRSSPAPSAARASRSALQVGRSRTAACVARGLMVCAFACASLAAQESPSAEELAALQALVTELGAPEFDRRDAATKAILARGTKARAAIEALREEADLEARLRIDAILARLSDPVRHLPLEPKGTIIPRDISGLSLGKAIDELARLSGINISLDLRSRGGNNAAEQPEVHLEIGGMPFFRAIDAVCEQNGLYFSRDHLTGGLILRPGVIFPGLVQYRGPLRFSARSMQVGRRTDFSGAPTVNANLSFVLDAEPRTGVLGVLMPSELPPAIDDQGREVEFKLLPQRGQRDLRLLQNQRRTYIQFQLDAPEPDAKEFPDFRLPLEMVIAREVVDSEISGPDLGPDGGPQGVLALRWIDSTEVADQMRITLGYEPPAASGPVATRLPVTFEQLEIYDEQGKPIKQLGGQARSRAAKEQRITITVPKTTVSRIRMTALSRWEIQKWTFSFPSLPLP